MKEQNQELIIILPEGMENMPVRVTCDNNAIGITINVFNSYGTKRSCSESEGFHTAIFHQDRYEHILMKEILWFEADGSYCHLYTENGKKITLSYPLSQIQKVLPERVFIRIHRSYLVNIDHIKYIVGKSIVVGDKFLKIGKEYRNSVLDRFVFIGIRRRPDKEAK